MRLFATALLLTVLAAPAQAEWRRAATRHFVIYSEGGEAEVRDLATRLERFDAAVRYLHGLPDPPEVAANPLTIFVVDDLPAVERLCGCTFVAGFYVPRVDGAVAYTPRRGNGDGRRTLTPQTVLLHEYAHHMVLGGARTAVPAWYSEGYAEFVATATIDADTVQFGHAANHRTYGLHADQRIAMSQLFAPSQEWRPSVGDQVYARGWLLTHYLMLNRERTPQLNDYLRRFAAGEHPVEAAKHSFGDLRKLDGELQKYLSAKTLPSARVPVSKLPPVTPDIRPLTPGERALIELRMQSERGVERRAAQGLFRRARKVNVPASDAVAQGWLAEMAFDAGDDGEAEAAADRALAVDPTMRQALLYKARAQMRALARAKSADAAKWREARSWITRANRAEPNNAAALALFYDSFRLAGAAPNANAVAALRRALELAPQDASLRLKAVRQHLADGQTDEARRVLLPIALTPHADPDELPIKLMRSLTAGDGKALALLDAEESKALAKLLDE